MKKLNEYGCLGVVPMTEKEMKNTRGGVAWLPVVAFAIVILNTDWDRAVSEFREGWNSL